MSNDEKATTSASFEVDVSWYRSLPTDPQLIRIFTRTLDNIVYSVCGEDALFIARIFYKTMAVVRYAGGSAEKGGLPYVNMNRSLTETVLRELLVDRAEYSVELYEGMGRAWKVYERASPGRLGKLEEFIYRNAEMAEVPVVMAIQVSFTDGARIIGAAFTDAATRRIGACEFQDDDHFCHLEALVSQLGTKEVVLCQKSETEANALPAADARRLKDMLARCNALAADKPKSIFATKNLDQDLKRVLKDDNLEHHRPILDRPLASQALAALLAFLELTADPDNFHKYHLSLHDLGRYMRLDAEAQRALNVFRSRTDTSDSFSLYGLLNRCRTAMGKRLLRQWLQQPLLDATAINARLDIVEAAVRDPTLRTTLRDAALRGLPDVERLGRKLERRKTNLADLCQLYRAAARLATAEAALRAHDSPHSETLVKTFADPLAVAHDADHLQKFEELLEAAVDLDKIPDEYLICPDYHADLATVAEQKASLESRAESAAKKAAKDLGLEHDKTLRLDWHKAGGSRIRVMRITAKEEAKVRAQLAKSYTIVASTKGDGTKFTNRELKATADELQQLTSRYEELQRELIQQVVEVAASFVDVWEQVGSLLAQLDVLLAFADLAAQAPVPYVRPEIHASDAGATATAAASVPPVPTKLLLRGCRHPCVEAQEGVAFIANDCIMERDKSWFQIITGPNMGGKSTFIRQIGVCVLMAQVGCFVPCDEAIVPVRDAIFARVGAGDCQLRGVSTFMAEMLETAAILKGATNKSLVIVDELGRGTSTFDGFGLAWAISEHLLDHIQCPTLFATHFHELTALETETKQGRVGVSNLHVETAMDRASGKLTMLYHVKQGACDQSFGIHVAEFANFPSSVVSMAKRKAEELEGGKVTGGVPRLGGGALPPNASSSSPREEASQLAKRRRQALLSARGVVDRFAKLPLDTMEPAAALEKTREMLQGLDAESTGNICLAELLETGTVA